MTAPPSDTGGGYLRRRRYLPRGGIATPGRSAGDRHHLLRERLRGGCRRTGLVVAAVADDVGSDAPRREHDLGHRLRQALLGARVEAGDQRLTLLLVRSRARLV